MADRTIRPLRRRHILRRAGMFAKGYVEALESRTLLSNYSFTALGTFASTFGEPMHNLVQDSQGNFFGVATTGGANQTGGIFRLGTGNATPTLSVSFPAGFTPGDLTIDGNGNIFFLGYTTANLIADTPADLSVYELGAGGTSLQTVADLGDNTLPQGDSTGLLDSGGTLYGVTGNGGDNREGEIFKILQGGSIATVLASFPNTGAGGIPGTEQPNGNLVIDATGDLFGTTGGSGTFATGDGTIFELPQGQTTITNIYTFDGMANGSAPTGLTMDANGNMFGAVLDNHTFDHTTLGGLFELQAGATTPTFLASFTAATGYNTSFPLAVDNNGNLFGATEDGGAISNSVPNGDGVVFELPVNSQTITAIHTFTGASDGQIPFGGVIIDSSGDVFGTDIGPGESGTGLVFKLSPGGGGGGGGGGGTGTLSATLSGKLPTTSIIAGSKTHIAQTLTLTNSGSGILTDHVSVGLELSTATTIDSNSIALPVSLAKSFKLKAGAHATLHLNLKSIAASVPDGTYYLVAPVTDAGGTIDAASTGTITIAPAEIDLSGSIGKIPASIAIGKKLTVSLTVTNTGNTSAVGLLPVLADLSADGLADNSATQLLTASPKVNVKPGKSAHLKVHAVAPSVSPGSYFVVAVLDQGGTIIDDNLANNTLVSAIQISVT